MISEDAPIDISKAPELLKVAEEVRRTNRPRVLRHAGEDIAVISPLRKAVKRSLFRERSAADMEAIFSAAGGVE